MKKAATVLSWFALVSLILTLGSAFIAIWLQLPPKDDLLRLTSSLLSWQVIAGGLAVGGASTFAAEIKDSLKRAPKS